MVKSLVIIGVCLILLSLTYISPAKEEVKAKNEVKINLPVSFNYNQIIDFFHYQFPGVKYDYRVMNPKTWKTVHSELGSTKMLAEYIGIICQESKGQSGSNIRSNADAYNIAQLKKIAVNDLKGNWSRAKEDGIYNAVLGARYYRLLFNRYGIKGTARAKYCYNRGISSINDNWQKVTGSNYVKRTDYYTLQFLNFINR